MVSPAVVQHALQGHPEAGKLWEKHITSILTSSEFGIKSTTHEYLHLPAWMHDGLLMCHSIRSVSVTLTSTVLHRREDSCLSLFPLFNEAAYIESCERELFTVPLYISESAYISMLRSSNVRLFDHSPCVQEKLLLAPI